MILILFTNFSSLTNTCFLKDVFLFSSVTFYHQNNGLFPLGKQLKAYTTFSGRFTHPPGSTITQVQFLQHITHFFFLCGSFVSQYQT